MGCLVCKVDYIKYVGGVDNICHFCIKDGDRLSDYHFKANDGLKRCRGCYAIKPVSEYSKRKRYADGLRSRCHNCEYKRKKKRIKEDFSVRLITIVRTRLNNALKKMRLGKISKTQLYLGIGLEEYKLYLESKFEPGMTWDNYGVHGWHIDHIIPVSSFDLTQHEEIKKAFHYSNTQPMWAKINWSKGSKT